MNAQMVKQSDGSANVTQRLRTRLVVIAVDGSAASLSALTWARDELLESGDQVRVITAYACPQYNGEYPVLWRDVQDTAEAARLAGADAIASVLGTDRRFQVEQIVECGSIDDVLDRHSDDASLIVVGSGSRRRFRDRLRASTSRRIIGRTACPVVTVPKAA